MRGIRVGRSSRRQRRRRAALVRQQCRPRLVQVLDHQILRIREQVMGHGFDVGGARRCGVWTDCVAIVLADPGVADMRSSCSEVHSGHPSGAVTTWTFPPCWWCLPDHHRSTFRPCLAVGPGAPCSDRCGSRRRRGARGSTRRCVRRAAPVQARRGRGEDVDALVQVAVGRRGADALSTASWATRVASTNQRSTSTACRHGPSARRPRRVPPSRRWTANSWARRTAVGSPIGSAPVQVTRSDTQDLGFQGDLSSDRSFYRRPAPTLIIPEQSACRSRAAHTATEKASVA
jgi:hypothetical protein